MKTRFLIIALVVLAVLASFATPVTAQVGKIQGAPRPGMVIGGGGPEPAKTGVNVKVLSYWGTPVPGVTLVISLMKNDDQTGEPFPDYSTSKRFEPCGKGQSVDCTKEDGTGFILTESLPRSESSPDYQRELDIRGEAMSYTHDLYNPVRVILNGNPFIDALVYMFWNGFEAGQPYAYHWNDQVIVAGFWARQDSKEEVIVDYFWKGSSTTKTQVKYRGASVRATIGPGQDGGGEWIEVPFWTLRNNTAYYGGSVCGEIQIRSAKEAEKVLIQFKDVCVKMRRPDWVPIPIGDKK